MTRISVPLAVNLVATAFMTGVIWFVQLVHYPLMAGWPHDDFGRWEGLHRASTEWIVVPVMLLEGLSGAWLLVRTSGVRPWLAWTGLILLVAIWASTFCIQVPCHRTLSLGWDADAHARLVSSNWLRTGLWSSRLALVSWAVIGRRRPSDP